MRNRLWNWIVARHPQGALLPLRLLVVRAALFPLDFFYWRFSRERGYQWQADEWVVEGVHYSGAALRLLAAAQGETYRVTRTGQTVTFERVSNEGRVKT